MLTSYGITIKKILPPLARREVPELVTQTAHNTVIRNPNQSLNNNVFSFSSQHQPPRRCGATSIDGDELDALMVKLAIHPHIKQVFWRASTTD